MSRRAKSLGDRVYVTGYSKGKTNRGKITWIQHNINTQKAEKYRIRYDDGTQSNLRRPKNVRRMPRRTRRRRK